MELSFVPTIPNIFNNQAQDFCGKGGCLQEEVPGSSLLEEAKQGGPQSLVV